jgi:hypothetical protein
LVCIFELNKKDKSMALGGKRPGAGRKPVHDEIEAKNISQKAIINKFGSLQEGMEFLLGTGEPTLIKFVYEHCFGKPKERHDIEMQGEPVKIEWPDGD